MRRQARSVITLRLIRPSVMTTHKLRVAEEMYRSGQYTVAAIAKTLGVSRASIYRHVTGDVS